MNLTIIIPAAGPGRRMKSALPKAMHKLAGQPMVRFVVEAARALEPSQLAVVVGSGADLISQAVGEGVTYISQAEQRGSGHAVLQAQQEMAGRAGTVLVLFGDRPLIRPETLRGAVDQHQTEKAAMTLVSFHPQDARGYGRLVREAGTGQVLAIAKVQEFGTEQQELAEASAGVFVFRDEWLWANLGRVEPSGSGEYRLTELVTMAQAQGEAVGCWPVADPGEGLAVRDRVSLAQAEAEMRRRINERWMRAGVTLIHPETTYIDAAAEIGGDTTVWPNTLLQGQTRIGAACTIGPGAVIRDSTIGDGCKVELSVVEGAIMEEESEIGPFGHLRKGAHLAKRVHMGNFGEVKNSYLGPGVKMGHFSYVGDSTVGAEANIGAGTITCNYDGQRKHHTTIGEQAFIGSGTMLVAPVEIGDGAQTGAGSVVTRNVPARSVAYGVPARIQPARETEGSEVK